MDLGGDVAGPTRQLQMARRGGWAVGLRGAASRGDVAGAPHLRGDVTSPALFSQACTLHRLWLSHAADASPLLLPLASTR